MKKKILLIFLTILSVFLLCSCEEEMPKTPTSISTSFKIEGVNEADAVTIIAKENTTKKEIKIKIVPKEEKVAEIEPGTYLISSVSAGTKRINISINEQFFNVNKSNKNITFTVKEEIKKNGVEWFFYNNTVYILCLVGCSIFLGVNKYRKEKKLRMR